MFLVATSLMFAMSNPPVGYAVIRKAFWSEFWIERC